MDRYVQLCNVEGGRLASLPKGESNCTVLPLITEIRIRCQRMLCAHVRVSYVQYVTLLEDYKRATHLLSGNFGCVEARMQSE